MIEPRRSPSSLFFRALGYLALSAFVLGQIFDADSLSQRSIITWFVPETAERPFEKNDDDDLDTVFCTTLANGSMRRAIEDVHARPISSFVLTHHGHRHSFTHHSPRSNSQRRLPFFEDLNGIGASPRC